MNRKMNKLISLFIVFFTMFLININGVFATTVSLPDYCTNPSSSGDIMNGHLCASSDIVAQCNVANFSSGADFDENGGKPTECGSECEGYYYSFTSTTDDMFVSDENSVVYRQMICNGLTYNGKKLNYLYTRNDKIKSVEKNNPEFYAKVKADLESDTADSEMGNKEATTDDENAKNSTIKNTDVDGLDPNGNNITINCSDFSALHIIYNIVLIIAPILVILFGTIDYSKAVMTSDLEKMDKFKKRFKPRLIAVIVLFLVPLLIKLILSLNPNLSNTMLNCVVNGKDAEIKLNASEATGSTGIDTGSVKSVEGKNTSTNTGDGGGSSKSFGNNTDTTTTQTPVQDSDGSAKIQRSNSTGDCSKCAKIPSSYTSARAQCEKANNCKIINNK